MAGTATTGTDKSARLAAPTAGTLTEAYGLVRIPASDGDLHVDINKGVTCGASPVTIFTGTEYFIIASGSYCNDRGATGFKSTSFNKNDWFSVDIDQVGSVVDLSVQLRWDAA